MPEKNKEILALFSQVTDIESVKEILDIDIGKVPLGMTEFQINNFVLNRREFPTDLMQFQQTKLEIHTRILVFADLYYQYRDAKARIKLAEGKIEDLKNTAQGLNAKVKEAKIELQEIEIEKNQFKLKNIQHMAKEKLRETLAFYKAYQKFRLFESMKPEELAKLEEEGWKIKSAYYPEIQQRYCLTPDGFIPLPHEQGGLQVMIDRSTKHGNGDLQ